MNRSISFLIAACCLGIGSDAFAQRSSAGVIWSAKVFDILGEHQHIVTSDASAVSNTGLSRCIQSPPQVFKMLKGTFKKDYQSRVMLGLAQKSLSCRHVTLPNRIRALEQ